MDSSFNISEEWYEDDPLHDYGNSCFIFKGVIYTVIDASEESILEGLDKIYQEHSDPSMKFQALQSMSSHISESITNKYCN